MKPQVVALGESDPGIQATILDIDQQEGRSVYQNLPPDWDVRGIPYLILIHDRQVVYRGYDYQAMEATRRRLEDS